MMNYKCYLKHIMQDLITNLKPNNFTYFFLIFVVTIPLAIGVIGGNTFHVILYWFTLIAIMGGLCLYEYLKGVKRYCDRKIEHNKRKV